MAKSKDEVTSRGTSKSVPCPWCGEANLDLDSLGTDENNVPIVRTDCILECDHCHNLFQLTSVYEVTHVVAERYGDMQYKGHLK